MSDPQALHAELLRRSDDWLDVVLSPQPFAAAVKAVLELHKPQDTYGSSGTKRSYLQCTGCDQGPHYEDDPDWPCSTVLAIAAALGVTTDG
jgi:hypothetical protein